MTSIEILIKEISEILGPLKTDPLQDLLIVDAINKTKEMHKKEVIEARNDMQKNCINLANKITPNLFSFDEKDGEKYYKKTFKK